MSISLFYPQRHTDFFARELTDTFSNFLHTQEFILGEGTKALEEKLSVYFNRYAVCVSSGTSALRCALEIFALDGFTNVVVPSFSAWPTFAAAYSSSLNVQLSDFLSDSWTLNSALLAESSSETVYLPVHLFSDQVSCNTTSVIEDASQAFGFLTASPARFQTLSFYPTKNLGAHGECGAVLCRTAEDASRIRQLRSYGSQNQPFDNVRPSELQCRFLVAKFERVINELRPRKLEIRDRYLECIQPFSCVTTQPSLYTCQFPHQIVFKFLTSKQRNLFRHYMHQFGIMTQVHYQLPGDWKQYSKSTELQNTLCSVPSDPLLLPAEINTCINAVERVLALLSG